MLNGDIDVLELTGDITHVLSLEGNLLPIGPKGDKGDPGFSPVVTTSKSGKTTTVKFETATGDVYAYIQDGADGEGKGDMLTEVYDQNKNGIVDNAEKVNNHTVLTDVPANAVFTDTVYDDTEVRGLINAKPNFSDIPTNVSQLTNDANYVTSNGNAESTQTNVSSATFTNTLEAPMNIDLKGNTLQNGTPTPSSPIPINNVNGDNDIVVCGKNLFNKDNAIDNYRITQTGTPYSDNNYYISSYIKVIPNTQYTKNSPTADAYHRYAFYEDSNTDSFIDVSSDNTITTPSNCKYIRFCGAKTEKDTTMLVVGNEIPTTYEAYNGTTYNIDLPVENLFDKDNANVLNGYINSGGTITSEANNRTIYIPCKPNTTYTISKIVTQRFRVATYTSTPQIGSTTSNYAGQYSDTSITITSGASDKYLAVWLYNGGLDTKTYQEVIDTLQIEQGSKPNTYTPYGTTPIELNKIGTYQDYFYKENDKWYLHKEIGKYTFTGDETFNLQNGNKRIHILNTNNQLGDILKTTGGSGILYGMYSNKLEEKTGSQTWSGMQGISYDYNSGANQEDIDISINGLTTIEQYKNAINGITMYFILNTPTNTEITYTPLIEQLESIKNAMSKEGTTNVNQVNNDAPFILDLSVFNDTYNGRYQSVLEMYKRLKEAE